MVSLRVTDPGLRRPTPRSKRHQKSTRISCRWQTRGATRCTTANVLQTNKVDARCDKLATELSRQRFALNSPICSYRTCIKSTPFAFGASIRVTPVEFCLEIFGIRKLDSLGYPVALFAWFYIQAFQENTTRANTCAASRGHKRVHRTGQ